MAMPARGPREIQAIIEAFNRMQGRLSRFVEDRTRMIAAISHDLRTPLTRLQLRLESPDVLAERQRMLTDLHAADAGQSVTFSGTRGVAISCRPIALRRAISNLVDNAIKYGTNATVHLAQEPERVVITIDDDGPGIPPSQRDKVSNPSTDKNVPVTPRPAVSGWAFRSPDPSYGSTMGISASPRPRRLAMSRATGRRAHRAHRARRAALTSQLVRCSGPALSVSNDPA
jgi:signal transduction histidine kinase